MTLRMIGSTFVLASSLNIRKPRKAVSHNFKKLKVKSSLNIKIHNMDRTLNQISIKN